MPFYAVARGHKTGIFLTWDECQKNTKGFSKPLFRKFNSREEAQDFMSSSSVPVNNQENTTGKSQSTNRPETRFYYACAGSRVGPAIFFSWQDCQKQVQGTPYKHQKFSNLTEAENFIVENNTTNGTKKRKRRQRKSS